MPEIGPKGAKLSRVIDLPVLHGSGTTCFSDKRCAASQTNVVTRSFWFGLAATQRLDPSETRLTCVRIICCVHSETFTSPIRELYLSNDALFKRLSTRLRVQRLSKSEESWITLDNLSYVRYNRLLDVIFRNKARFLSVRRIRPYPAGDYLFFEITVHMLPGSNS